MGITYHLKQQVHVQLHVQLHVQVYVHVQLHVQYIYRLEVNSTLSDVNLIQFIFLKYTHTETLLNNCEQKTKTLEYLK